MEGRPGPRGRFVLGVIAFALIAAAAPALATHLSGWTHDHSGRGIPYRPHGDWDLRNTFGQPCNSLAGAGRSYWPSAPSRGQWGYLNYHQRMVQNIGYNIQGHYNADHNNGASDFGVYGYNCRMVEGSSSWSSHAYGAAIDTNTYRNPQGQTWWNGRGSDGHDYGHYIPHQWKQHNWQWGAAWNDPHHFQYVTGY